MDCPNCRSANSIQQGRCSVCGLQLPNPQLPPNGQPLASQNPFAELPPGQSTNPYAAPLIYPAMPAGYQNPPLEHDPMMRLVIPIGTSGWAIASGYLGLISLSIVFGCLGPFAIVTGILAFRHIRRTPRLGGTVRAVIGIGLGLLGTIGFTLMIIAALMG